MQRTLVTQDDVQKTIRQVVAKLEYRLREKGTGAFTSRHEGLGVIAEEYAELLDAVRRDHNHKLFMDECVDVAVSCLFAIASMRANTREAGGEDA